MLQAAAVLVFAEPVLDDGPPSEPRFQDGDVTVVSGDVDDNEAVGVGVGGAFQRNRQLPFGDRATPPGPGLRLISWALILNCRTIV